MRLTYLEIEFFETSGQQLRRIYNVGSYVTGQVKVGFSKPAKLAGRYRLFSRLLLIF